MMKVIVFAAALLINSSVFGAVALEHFAALPKFSTPKISPDGKRIASTITYQGKPLLVVQTLEVSSDNSNEVMKPINAGENFISWYEWGNDERLIFSLRSNFKMRGGLWNLGRMGSIGRDGKDAFQFKMTQNDWGMYRQNAGIVSFLEDDPDHILATLDDVNDSWATPEVHRVNISTGERKRVLNNRLGAQRLIADNSGIVRVAVKTDITHHLGVTVYYRNNNGLDWETLQKLDYFNQDRLVPYRFDSDDDNILLVTSGNLDAADESKLDLFRYDLTARKVLGPYQDDYHERVVAIAERSLPDMEVEVVSHNKEKTRYTFRAYTDVQPPEYYLLDLDKKSLQLMGEEYPDLKNAQLAKMQEVSYSARDELQIPAFLTIPNGSKPNNLPMVIYPHGGPWANDVWGFDNYVQFFASRGYAVFQPQFRGSTGHGIDHQEAGYGEWGYAIQDDITDGVHWLIAQGIADPDRICIVGSSFGGYAAAMGVAKTPDLFRCAISINGVLDFKKMMRSQRKFLFSAINRAITKGDGDSDMASPYHMAKDITAPLLLIGSELDTIVPVDHSITMYKKLKSLNKSVHYIELPRGEHWRTIEANEVKKLAAVEEFLAEHLAPVEKNTDSAPLN